ncbi:MAG: hypothetical protein D6797_02370 [Bdellovibrio sp.]|nr:MAG: hypothetical protein D6797_02370 [Bdellovibrio sp.]
MKDIDSPHHIKGLFRGFLRKAFSRQEEESFLQQGAIFQWSPHLWVMGWGNRERRASPLQEKIHFFVPDFYLEEPKPWVVFENVAIFESFPFRQEMAFLSRLSWQPPLQEEFERIFLRVQRELQSGNLLKAVPVIKERAAFQMKPLNIKALLRAAHKTQQFVYGYWEQDKKEGVLGATPEVLFSLKPPILTTMALAGTRALGAPSLLESVKDIKEHQIVVDRIVNVLSEWGRVSKKGPYEEPVSGGLVHLRTDIEIHLLKVLSFEQGVRLLHPTPALGLSSEVYDWKWLKNLEELKQRRYFGAPFGVYFPDGSGKSLVAIRNVEWDGENVYIQAGCGVVKESNLKSEWQELALKREAVKKNLGLFYE